MEQEVKLPVRQLVEFVLRGGSIDNRFGGADRALEGSRIHRRLQKEAGEGYRAEVKFSHTCTFEGTVFTVEGRADGIFTGEDGLTTVDEIKTTAAPIEIIGEDFNRLHWAQAICYAHFLAVQEEKEAVAVRLTYFQIETEEVKRFTRRYRAAELAEFYEDLLRRYKVWADFQSGWEETRNCSIQALSFPFPEYRKGQRQLAVAVYRAIQRESRVFCQAPTGIGKTISTLFPAVKAMGEGLTEKIFYLTAKTITRQAAEQAFSLLRRQPLRLKTVTLTAKDKICFLEERRCNPVDCPYADGHFDRVNSVLFAMLQKEDAFSREIIEKYAREGRVCPFELGLDLTLWADCIICDYNYLFDPVVSLKRFFADSGGDYAFLIDEAHNLVDRAREMYSARLSKSSFRALKTKLGKGAGEKKLKSALGKADTALRTLRDECEPGVTTVREEPPEEFFKTLSPLVSKMEDWLRGNLDHPLHGEVLELYFQILAYQRTGELFDEHYVAMLRPFGYDITVTLFCRDPSALLDEALKKGRASVLFSATLSPMPYYREVLGGGEEAKLLQLPSPFPQENLSILIADRVSTRYQDREKSLDEIAGLLAALARGKTGNYMFFFPSYAYCRQVYEKFLPLCGEEIRPVMQESGLTEEEREKFLAQFEEAPAKSLAAFCVMGGIFSEGIDLQGERLIGAAIVGVGLPQIGPEPDVIRDYYQQKNGSGFDYAYRFPGMNKVMQAAGRVIRGGRDRGVVLLIDERFASYGYRALLPAHWSHARPVRSKERLEEELQRFWSSADKIDTKLAEI